MGAWGGCGGPGGARALRQCRENGAPAKPGHPLPMAGAQPGWPHQPCWCPVSPHSHTPPVPDAESSLPGEDFISPPTLPAPASGHRVPRFAPSPARSWQVPVSLPRLSALCHPGDAATGCWCFQSCTCPRSHPVPGDTASPVPPCQGGPKSTSPLLGRSHGPRTARPPQSSSPPAHPRCCRGAPSGSPHPVQPTGPPTARPGTTAQLSATLAPPPRSAQHHPAPSAAPGALPAAERCPCCPPGTPAPCSHRARCQWHGGCWRPCAAGEAQGRLPGTGSPPSCGTCGLCSGAVQCPGTAHRAPGHCSTLPRHCPPCTEHGKDAAPGTLPAQAVP